MMNTDQQLDLRIRDQRNLLAALMSSMEYYYSANTWLIFIPIPNDCQMIDNLTLHLRLSPKKIISVIAANIFYLPRCVLLF